MIRKALLWHIAAAVVAVPAACSFDWEEFDPRLVNTPNNVGGDGGADGGGGGVTDGGFGGSGGSGGQSAGGRGGFGGAGGQPMSLVDRGLLTRYHLDEAATGRMPTTVDDSAPNPLALDLEYGTVSDPPVGTGGGGGAGGSAPIAANAEWTEVDGHRGLRFVAKNRSGGASSTLNNTKLSTLDGLTEATIECVAEIDNVGGASVCNRLYHVGVDNFGQLTLCALPEGLRLAFNGSAAEEWNVNYAAVGRMVMHTVLDTTQAADDRVLLYINGVDQGVGPMENNPPPDLAAINLSGGRHVVGNRNSNDGTIEGVLYYCALYSVALTPTEITNNANVLLAHDDAP